MNSDEQDSPAQTINAVLNAIRFALVAILLGLSYFSLRSSLSIGNFESIFRDMLEGRPLPVLTRFVLGARPFFVAAAFLVPLAAIATLFLRRLAMSFYIIGALAFITVVQVVVLYEGLTAPMAGIITRMAGTGDEPALPAQH